MTIITVTPKVAPPVTGLTAEGNLAGTGIMLDWFATNSDEMFATEIWWASSNDRSTASLLSVETGTSKLVPGVPGNTYYFWIRSINIYNYSSGDWFPTSSTGGVGVTVGLIDRTHVTVNEITEITIYTAGPVPLTNPDPINSARIDTTLFTNPAIPAVSATTTRLCYLSLQFTNYDDTPGQIQLWGAGQTPYYVVPDVNQVTSIGRSSQNFFVPFYPIVAPGVTNLDSFGISLINGNTDTSRWSSTAPELKQISLTIFTGKR